MKKAAKKKVIKRSRRNPDFNIDLENLLGHRVRVYGKFFTITGILQGSDESTYYVETKAATAYFKSKNIRNVQATIIYLEDMILSNK